MNPFTLVLGTRNQKKRRELEYLLKPHGILLQSLDDFRGGCRVGADPDVEIARGPREAMCCNGICADNKIVNASVVQRDQHVAEVLVELHLVP